MSDFGAKIEFGRMERQTAICDKCIENRTGFLRVNTLL